jgi:CRISPR-associated exonuclease Cas4
LRLGLVGQADVVEYHKQGDGWTPFPVEYKRGRPKPDVCDEVQLCAQAICLEEMIAMPIPEGAIFYGQPRRRHAVRLDDRLRAQTESAARRLHELIDRGETPPAVYEKKCESCSLLNVCMPKTAARTKSAIGYLREIH